MNIGKFNDVTELGRGGMGTVYAGYLDGRKVTIKKFRSDFMSETELINRFQREGQTLQKLDHSSIVKVIEPPYDPYNKFYPAFVEGGDLYIAMEFVEGVTLDKYVRNNGGPLTEDKAVRIMCNILDAMEYVRKMGIVHRDIKPNNIIVRPDGENVCILDFGIVKDLNSNGFTSGHIVLGTDGYMSPEQAKGLTVDYRTDIYSLGCVLFYMLTGTNAISQRGSDYETRAAILESEFPRAKDRNPAISDRVQAIIDKAVDKNMLLRFQSPAEFRMALIDDDATKPHNSPADGPKRISVGRGQTCDVQIYDPTGRVSRLHLDIEYQFTSEGDLYVIHDRSTNGTQVNGVLVHNGSVNIFPFFRGRRCADYPPEIILGGSVTLDWSQVTALLPGMEVGDGGENNGPMTHEKKKGWLARLFGGRTK